MLHLTCTTAMDSDEEYTMSALMKTNRLKRWWYRFEKNDDTLLRTRNDLELNQLIFEWMIEKRGLVINSNKGYCKLANHTLAVRLGLDPSKAILDGLMWFKRSPEEQRYRTVVFACLECIVQLPMGNILDNKETKKIKMFFVVPFENELDILTVSKIKNIYNKLKKGRLPSSHHDEHETKLSDLDTCINQVVREIWKDHNHTVAQNNEPIFGLMKQVYDEDFINATDTEAESDEEDSDNEMRKRLMAKLYETPYTIVDDGRKNA